MLLRVTSMDLCHWEVAATHKQRNQQIDDAVQHAVGPEHGHSCWSADPVQTGQTRNPKLVLKSRRFAKKQEEGK